MASKRTDREIVASSTPQSRVDMTSSSVVAFEANPGDGSLLDRIAAIIDQARSFLSAQANATLTLRNWHIGRMIDVEMLKEERAEYAKQIVASLTPQLAERFGRGFDVSNLYRMVKFSQAF